MDKTVANLSQTTVGSPTVSIGLPVHNGADYLAEAIESILAQTFADFELVIADNASTDETPEICKRYADIDKRITVVRHPRNIGAAKNFNYVVHCASGDYFKWAAHDDLIGPEFLAECLRGFEEHGEGTALVYPNFEFTDAQLNPVTRSSPFVHCISASPVGRLRTAIAGLGMVTSAFGLFRRDALNKTGLIRSHISSDHDLLIETALVGKIVRLEGEVLFTRRLHAGSSIHANPKRHQLLAWFDPDKLDDVGPFSSRYWRFLGSVNSVPGLSVTQRLAGSLFLFGKLLLAPFETDPRLPHERRPFLRRKIAQLTSRIGSG